MDLLKRLSRKKYKNISSALGAFDFGLMQDLLSLIIHLEYSGFSIRDFKSYVKYRQENKIKDASKAIVSNKDHAILKCPECGLPLQLFTVNKKSCEMVGGGYKTQVMCYDQINCGYERFSKKGLRQWKDELTIIMKDGKSMIFDYEDNKKIEQSNKESQGGCSGCG